MAQSSEVAAGDQALASQYNDLRDDALGVVLTNSSGAARSAGDVVIWDTAADTSFTTTTTEADQKVLGVVAETIADGAAGLVQQRGVGPVNVDAATSRGDYLVTSATAAKATPKAAFQPGVFAVALTASAGAGTVTAALIPTGLAFGFAHDHSGDAGDGGQLDLAALNVSGQAQGDILYRDASAWARLGAGTSGYFLKTQGASANPTWAAVASVTLLSTKVYDATSGVPTTWTDLDLSATVGSAQRIVLLRFYNKDTSTAVYWTRPNGYTRDIAAGITQTGFNVTGCMVLAGYEAWALCKTDASGVIEWRCSSDRDTEIYVEAYW